MTVSSERAKVRRERVQALAREDILDAALRCFAQHGYAQTKITDIAAAAGYTAASLYTYFPGKREIFVAAADHFVSGVEEAFGPVPEVPHSDFEAFAADVRERIVSLCEYGDRCSEVLAFFMRLRWSGEVPLEDLRTKARADGLAPDVAACAVTAPPLGGEHEGHGPFRLQAHFSRVWRGLGVERFGWDPDVVAGIVSGTIESFFVRRYIFGVGGTLKDNAETVCALLLYGLRGAR